MDKITVIEQRYGWRNVELYQPEIGTLGGHDFQIWNQFIPPVYDEL